MAAVAKRSGDDYTMYGGRLRKGFELLPNIRTSLVELSRVPDTDRATWLDNATESIQFLKKNLLNDEEILIYGSGPHFLTHAVLVPNSAITPPDHSDLSNSHIMPDDSWCIQRSYGGGEGHRVYLEPPLSHPGCKSLVGGEKMVFIRSFEGMKSHKPSIEINQKLVHSLNTHYLDERHAYCRLDQRGDIEDVISLYVDEVPDPWKKIRAVSIRRHDLATYMALTNTSLIARFDFTRFIPSGFSSWDGADEQCYEAADLYYRHRVVPGHASYANGHIILRTTLTAEDLVEQWKTEDDISRRRYASFKIIDRKNKKLVETSCSPQHIVNYFTDSDLPWEISPAFFRSEVLQKYKADPEKYTIEDRSISCRNAWYLKTYDINDAGQVHTYIGYLAGLPYEEQLYWQSFNEWPKEDISKRAYQTDILGQFSDDDDPLGELKAQVERLDRDPPSWWRHRGKEIIDEVLYPATDSVEEWGNEVLALDHLTVEGLLPKPLRVIIDANGGTYEKDWASLKLLEVALSVTGRTEEQAKAIVDPLRELHLLRNPAKAHGDPSGRREKVEAARKQHGTLRNHFRDLAGRVRSSLKQVITTLPKG